jgi:hypothetical protein
MFAIAAVLTGLAGLPALHVRAVARDDGWVYLFGTPNGHLGDAWVARVIRQWIAPHLDEIAPTRSPSLVATERKVSCHAQRLRPPSSDSDRQSPPPESTA